MRKKYDDQSLMKKLLDQRISLLTFFSIFSRENGLGSSFSALGRRTAHRQIFKSSKTINDSVTWF